MIRCTAVFLPLKPGSRWCPRSRTSVLCSPPSSLIPKKNVPALPATEPRVSRPSIVGPHSGRHDFTRWFAEPGSSDAVLVASELTALAPGMNTPRGTGQKGQCCPFGRRPVWLEGTASPPEWCTGTWQTAQLPLGPRFLPGHPMPHPVGPSLHTPPQMNNTQELEVQDFSYFTKLITNYFHWNKYCFQRHSFPHRIPVLKLPFQSVLDSYTISQFNTCDPGWLLTFPHDTPLLLLLHLYLTRGGRGNALRGRKEQIYLTILQISIKPIF